jgi:hypothetical protein
MLSLDSPRFPLNQIALLNSDISGLGSITCNGNIWQLSFLCNFGMPRLTGNVRHDILQLCRGICNFALPPHP